MRDQFESEVAEYMKDGRKVLVLETFPEIDYALIVRESTYEPFVAAWAFDEQTVTWGQGHYFSSMLDAVAWIQFKLDSKRGKITLDRMTELATNAMHSLEECEDEYAFEDFKHENDITESELEFFGFTESEVDEDDED